MEGPKIRFLSFKLVVWAIASHGIYESNVGRLPGVLKPLWIMGRVSRAKGQGRNFNTLSKPLLLVFIRTKIFA